MRVLVTYASRHGSTAEIADRVGQVLRVVLGMHVPDVQVDVVPIAKVRGVEGYDAVVVGSADLPRTLAPARSPVPPRRGRPAPPAPGVAVLQRPGG